MGGWYLLGEVALRLWIECAHHSLFSGEACSDAVRTFQTEGHFFAILASGPRGDVERSVEAASVVDDAASMLEQGTSLDKVVETVLDALPDGEHVPLAIFQVLEGNKAHVVECDAPPLFLTRGGQLVLPPVLEDICHDRLVRTCRFTLQDGDHMAMVSEGYIHAKGWSRRWGWRDIASATRRWTDTGCDADQLLGALIRMYRRLAGGELEEDVTVISMHVRPMRTATVWTGPPADPAQDKAALEKLMAEPGTRIICGDTTAQIAARLLGAELELEARPADGWAEVPPTHCLQGMDLVTEGLVTLGKARERLMRVEHVRDLPRKEDGAMCLARALLTADRIHFVVGLAINPAVSQAASSNAALAVPVRRAVVDELIHELKAKGRQVSVEYV